MRYLKDSDQQALRLAADLHKAMQQWLNHRGVDDSCTISPYVDATGQPAVLIKMNAAVAYTMVAGLNEQHARATEQRPTHGDPRQLPP